MELEQVWPVSIGDYSDYQVVMVCQSEAEAQRVVDHLNANKRSEYADEYVVDEPIRLRHDGDPLPKKVTVYSCTVHDNGRPDYTSAYEKWTHDVHPTGNRFYGGGSAADWPTPEEAAEQARRWQALK